MSYLKEAGYDYQFLDPGPTDDQKCPICHLVVREAHQVTCCGKLLCEDCLMRHLEHSQKCPMCRRANIRKNCFKDTKSDREIKSLKVYCVNKSNGCTWNNELKDIEDHLEDCLYQEIECNDCYEILLKINLKTHLSSECVERNYICRLCGKEDTYEYITGSHGGVCPQVQLECRNTGCTQKVRRHKMASHVEVCPKQIVECPFKQMECHFTSKREDLLAHVEKEVTLHIELVAQQVQKHHPIFPYSVFKFTGITLQETANKKMCSGSFYSGIGGYKLRISMYPNKSSHVGVYLQLMPGVNDDTLQFPLRGKVTITLLNQIEDQNHYEKIFTLSEKSNDSFCRKHAIDETGRGYPKFMPHASLKFNEGNNTQYLKDGALYFRITCAITSQAKPWLAVNDSSM